MASVIADNYASIVFNLDAIKKSDYQIQRINTFAAPSSKSPVNTQIGNSVFNSDYYESGGLYVYQVHYQPGYYHSFTVAGNVSGTIRIYPDGTFSAMVRFNRDVAGYGVIEKSSYQTWSDAQAGSFKGFPERPAGNTEPLKPTWIENEDGTKTKEQNAVINGETVKLEGDSSLSDEVAYQDPFSGDWYDFLTGLQTDNPKIRRPVGMPNGVYANDVDDDGNIIGSDGNKYDPQTGNQIVDTPLPEDTVIIRDLGEGKVLDNHGNIRDKITGEIAIPSSTILNEGKNPLDINSYHVDTDGNTQIGFTDGTTIVLEKSQAECKDHWITYTDIIHLVIAGKGISGESVSAEGDYRLGQFVNLPFNLITGSVNDSSILYNGSAAELTGFSAYLPVDTTVGDVDFDIECLVFELGITDGVPDEPTDIVNAFRYKRFAHVSFTKGQRYGRISYDENFSLGLNSWSKLTAMCKLEWIRINNLSYSAPVMPYCGKTDENDYSGGAISNDNLSPVSDIAEHLEDIKDVLKELVEAVQNIQPIIEISDDMNLDISTRRKKGFNTSYDVYEY